MNKNKVSQTRQAVDRAADANDYVLSGKFNEADVFKGMSGPKTLRAEDVFGKPAPKPVVLTKRQVFASLRRPNEQ